MKKIGFIFCLMIALVGCAKEELPITNVCQGSTGEVVLVSVGNEVQTITKTDTYTFNELSITKAFIESEDNQQQLLDNYQQLYNEISQGLDITMKIGEEEVTFVITIDLTTANFTELKKVGILSDDQMEYVGLEKTIEEMKLNCTIQE